MSHEKVLEGLEKLANAEGHPLLIRMERMDKEWMIVFSAGNNTTLTMKLTSFCRVPHVILEPFMEEMIKRLK